MPKTKLTLDTLSVDSFETEAPAANPRGTVHAHATGFTSYCQCQQQTHYGTCQGSCVNTCGGPTCDPPCRSTNTFYLTCQLGCSWTDGDATCIEPQTLDC